MGSKEGGGGEGGGGIRIVGRVGVFVVCNAQVIGQTNQCSFESVRERNTLWKAGVAKREREGEGGEGLEAMFLWGVCARAWQEVYVLWVCEGGWGRGGGGGGGE